MVARVFSQLQFCRVIYRTSRDGVINHNPLFHPIAQGPGPPHRPHPGPSPADAEDFAAPSATTAKTLSARAVCVDPHFSHSTVSAEFIDRISFSNFSPQLLH
jgi:hypothetical protein